MANIEATNHSRAYLIHKAGILELKAEAKMDGGGREERGTTLSHLGTAKRTKRFMHFKQTIGSRGKTNSDSSNNFFCVFMILR